MTITLGRCTLPSDPLISTSSMSGDVLTFSAMVEGVAQAGTAVDDMRAKIQQLRGLVDNADEDTFPCTFSSFSDWDGFYRDLRVTIQDDPQMFVIGRCRVSVSMRRVTGAASALFENTVTQTAITNGLSLPTVATDIRVGIPYAGTFDVGQFVRLDSGARSDTWATGGVTLTTDDGSVRVLSDGTGAAVMRHRWTWACTPPSYFVASARFEQSYGGTYYPLQGQQIPPSTAAWRISNGLVRVSLSATKIQVSHFDGSAWDTAKEWALGGTNGAGSTAPLMQAINSVRVLRNTPHTVVVKCGLSLDTVNSVNSLTITLRRGCRFASFDFRGSRADLIPTWYITNAEAGTGLTGGFRATSTDASGNRYVVGSPQGQTNSLAAGTLKRNDYDISGNGFQFCIGSEVGADGSGQTLINQYINSISEDQRVISR